MNYFQIGLIFAIAWVVVVWGSLGVTLIWQYLADQNLNVDETWWVKKILGAVGDDDDAAVGYVLSTLLFIPIGMLIAWPLGLCYLALRCLRFLIRCSKAVGKLAGVAHDHPASVKKTKVENS